MKIVIICPRAYHLFNPNAPGDFGGSEIQLSLIARELAKNDHLEIKLIVANYNQPQNEVIDKVRLIKSLNFKDSTINQIFSFIKVLFKTKGDVYIQRTLTPYSAFIALFCRIINKKFVYMVAHDMETDGSHPLCRGFIGLMSAKILFKSSHLVISQNQFQKKKLKENGINSTLIPSVYKADSHQEYNKRSVLWVGRCEKWKRPEIFLDLAEKFGSVQFVMICPRAVNDPEFFDFMRNRSNRIGNLEFIDFVPFNSIDKYFAQAKVFVNTSVNEGYPNTFMQAAQQATPVLSLSVNPNNFIVENRCGFYCQNQTEQLKIHLTMLLTDQKIYDEFSQNIYKYVITHHNVTKNVNQLLSCISQLSNKQAERRHEST